MTMVIIGDFIRIHKGRKAPFVFDKPIENSRRYLQIEDLRSNAHIKYALDDEGVSAKTDDIIIAWDGANAGTVGFGLEGYIGSTLAIMRSTRSDVYAPYLGYFLRGKFEYIRANSTGSTIPHVSKDVLENLEIPIVAFDEQRRIAAILEAVDHDRRRRQAVMELSDKFLQDVFVQMFGDPATNAMGWDSVAIETLFPKNHIGIRSGPFGSSLKRHEYVSAGVPVWVIDNLQPNEFIEEHSLFITQDKYKQLHNYSVESGDILISRAGTVGRMCVARPKQSPSIIGTNLVRVTLDDNKMLPDYFVALFTYLSDRIGRLRSSGDEDAYSFLNPSNLKALYIPKPPIMLQEKFVQITIAHKKSIAQQRESARQGEHLFQTLLHRAFNGEL